MTLHPTRIPVIFMLTTLAISACVPVPATPTPVPSTPTITETPGPTPTFTATVPPPITVDPASLRGVEIRVWHAFAGGAYDVFNRQADLFNATNEWGIKVTPAGYGDYTTLFDTMNAITDPGQTPELVVALPEQILAWYASGIVVDLNQYLRDPGFGMGSDTIADIPSVFWAQDYFDGKQLGLPAQRSARFLFYNETWARQLGFDQAPQTSDEFRQQACAANASFRTNSDPSDDGYGGWIVDSHWQTTYSWLLAFGGGVVDGNAYHFSNPANLAALQYLKGSFDANCAWLSTEPTPIDSFSRRSALFISADLADVTLVTESMARLKNSDQWTVIPFPGPTGQVLVTYGPSYALLKSTPEKQLAAWLFARWLLSPENQAQWVESTGLFPLRTSTLAMVAPYRAASLQWDAAAGFLPLAQGVPQLASWRKVRNVLGDGTTVLFQVNLAVDRIQVLLNEMDSTAQYLASQK
jgi:multiple sugar transport system substrate-binding protein